MADAVLVKSERARQADEFLSVAVWKSISFNSTSAKAGASPRFRMRIFAKGCPRHAIREVHESLAKHNPVVNPVVDGVVQPGTFYHRGAGYLKDERTSEAGTATYTLVRDFFDGPVSETDVVEDGCGNKTSIRFEWDRDDVEDLATLVNSLGGTDGVSPQGTVVRIAGISRDPESGLFSYYVTVTETKTIIFPEFTAAEDAFSRDKEASWLGLLGTAAAPIDSNTDSTPNPAVPAAGVSPDGTLTQVSWTKNRDDCTLNAQVKKRVATEDVTAGQSCVKTLFEHRDGLSVRAAGGPLGAAPEPANGVIVNNKDVLRPDKLWDTDKDTTQELPVASARVSSDVTAFETNVVTVSRSQAKGSAPAASASGGVITAPTVEKTPGDLENVTVAVKTELPGARSVTDSEDAFTEEHVVEDVAAAALGDAPAAAAGLVTTHTDNNTPGGLFGRRKTTRKEKTGLREVVKRDNLFESAVVTDDVAAAPLGDPPAAAAGVITDHVDQNTPGGLYRRRKTVSTDKPGARASTTDKTAYDVTEETADVAAVPLGEAPVAAGGVITAHTDQNMPSGLVSRRKRVKRETAVEAASESLSVTPWASFKTVSDKSMAVKKVLPAGEFGQVRNTLTPGNMYDRETTQLVPGSVVAGTILSHTKGGNKFSTMEMKETVETVKDFGVTGLTNDGVPGAAQIRDVTFSLQEDGTYRKRETVRIASAKIWIYASYSYTDYNTNASLPDVTVSVYHYQFLNASEAEAVALLGQSVSGSANVRVSCRMDINEFGLYGGTFHRTVRTESAGA